MSSDGLVLRQVSAGFEHWVGPRWAGLFADGVDARTAKLGGRSFAVARIDEADEVLFVAIEEPTADALPRFGAMVRRLVHDTNNALSGAVATTWVIELEEVPEDIRQDLEAMRTSALRAAAIGRDIAALAAPLSSADPGPAIEGVAAIASRHVDSTPGVSSDVVDAWARALNSEWRE